MIVRVMEDKLEEEKAAVTYSYHSVVRLGKHPLRPQASGSYSKLV